MNYLLCLIPFFCMSLHALIQVNEDFDWTKVYKQVFTQQEMYENRNRSELVYTQTHLARFTQLIFSWNAQRPVKGHFSFYVQVQDAHTGKWYDYHHLLDWGNEIQQSYFNRSGGSTFHHARLELEGDRKASAFRVKVLASDKHDLSLVKALIISASDFTQFKPEPWAEQGKGLSSFVINAVPAVSQFLVNHPQAPVLCSPTSVSMVVGALKGRILDPLLFADHVYDSGLKAFGNWAFNTAYAYELCNEKVLFYPTRLGSFNDLHALLQQRIPIVVSVRGPLVGSAKPYEHGHLLVVIGYDAEKKEVICHDPAFETDEKVLAFYGLHEFIQAWERSKRMTYKPQLIY